VELVLIDEHTRLHEIQKELRWNEAYYLMAKGVQA
jgi:L-arabinose isomerase